MTKTSKPDKQDYLLSILYILLYILAIGIGAFLFLPNHWYLWIILVILGLVLLVNWHKESTAYRCPVCSHEYTISFLTDLAAPHGIDRQGPWLLLKCPKCKARSKTRVLKRIE
jgi:hypothetical protein